MKVGELGEFGLIDHLAQMIAKAGPGEGVVLGIGDDAACWRSPGGLELATTDSLVENVHFLKDKARPQELGWKALAVNISDIAAMGGEPRYALISLALPPDTEVEWVTALYRGLLEIAGIYRVSLVGGDVHSASQAVVTVALWGFVAQGTPLLRSAARPGDAIAITGTLGNSAGGLRMLREGLHFPQEIEQALRQAHLRPVPRVQEGQILRRSGVKAAIDISDGLIADLGHVCQASGVAARIEAAKIPVPPALKQAFPAEALSLALSGGEDYELLCTAPPEIVERVGKDVPLTNIGSITSGPAGQVVVVDERGVPIPEQRMGWDHFVRP